MMNLFMPYRILAISILAGFLVFLFTGISFYMTPPSLLIAVAGGGAVLCLVMIGYLSLTSNPGASVSNQAVDQVIWLCQEVDSGNFESRITVHSEGKEQELYDALNAMIDRTDAFVREAGAAMYYASEKKYYRKIVETGLTGTFLTTSQSINRSLTNMAAVRALALRLEKEVGQVVLGVSHNTGEIVEEAESMGRRVDTSTSGTMTVAAAAISASENVATVAAACEQLNASVSEISSQVENSALTAQNTMADVNDIKDHLESLSDEAESISSVVAMILKIAEQTNLLALNATIEAARAGEAGKGFAVVAGEVKTLATQTQEATAQITEKVSKIQSATGNVVKRSEHIIQGMHNMHDMIYAIAAAVTEQEAATADMNHRLTELSIQSETVTDKIQGIAQASAQSFASALRVMWSANDQVEPVEKLDSKMGEFVHVL